MAGLGWSKLLMACALVGGCQQLEYVDDEGDADASDDGNAEWNIPPEHEDEPEDPPTELICAIEGVCECYGANQVELCDLVVQRTMCGWDTHCIALDPDAREACLVGRFCYADGHVEGDTVVCDVEPLTCAGKCDRDPSDCDADGDGVLSFSCGLGAEQCEVGQYCLQHAGEWSCNDECTECDHTPGELECISVPAECEGLPLEMQTECIVLRTCEFGWAEGTRGHQVNCGENTCYF